MSRKGKSSLKRVQSGVFHVILNGVINGMVKGIVFRSDDDKIKFLKLLNRFLDKEKSILYGFVLMDTHVHLLLETSHLSLLMRDFVSTYSSWFNLHHNIKGQVFEKSFNSVPKIYKDWKADCLLYILLNPVEAGICKHPSQYRFSSYSFYSDRSSRLKAIITVSPDIINLNFNSYQEFRKALYCKLEYQMSMIHIKYRKY